MSAQFCLFGFESSREMHRLRRCRVMGVSNWALCFVLFVICCSGVITSVFLTAVVSSVLFTDVTVKNRQPNHLIIFHSNAKGTTNKDPGNITTGEEEGQRNDTRPAARKLPKHPCFCQCRPSDRIPAGRIRERSCKGLKRIGLTMGFTALLDMTNGVYSEYSGKGNLSYVRSQGHSKTLPGASEQRLQAMSSNAGGSTCCKLTANFKITAEMMSTNSCSIALHNDTNNATRKKSGATVCCEFGRDDQSENGEEGGDNNGGVGTLVSLAIIAAVVGDHFMRKHARKAACSLKTCLHKTLQTNDVNNRIEKDSECLDESKGFEDDTLCKYVNDTVIWYKQWARSIATFRKIWVAPVTRFLPAFGLGNPLDYEGYRFASMAALPTSCKLSRLRLASAGFHFDPAKNINAVVCHKCGASISVGASPQECSPLAYHHRQSPNCTFVKDIMDTFTDDPASLSPMSFSGANPGQNQPASMGSSGSSFSPTSSLSTASSLGTSSLSSSAFPSSMSSARSLQTTSSLSSVSTGRTYATETSEYSSLPQLSSVGETSLSSGSTLPPMVAAGVDLPDSRGDLMTDDAEASPAADSYKPAPHRQQASTNSGYYMALPSTGENVLMSASLVPSSRPSMPVPIASSSSTSAAAVQSSIPGLDDKPTLDLSGAVYPQFSTVHTRMTTFAEWPLERYFPASHMVNIGFYFAGYADCVRCFYCGVGLKTWFEDDDALVEHIRWRPNCQFILATKGRQFVADTLARIEAAERNSNTDDTSRPALQSAGQQTTNQTSPSSPASTLLIQNQTPPQQQHTGIDRQTMEHLTTMGFGPEVIAGAAAQLRRNGRQPTLEDLLNILLGGLN